MWDKCKQYLKKGRQSLPEIDTEKVLNQSSKLMQEGKDKLSKTAQKSAQYLQDKQKIVTQTIKDSIKDPSQQQVGKKKFMSYFDTKGPTNSDKGWGLYNFTSRVGNYMNEKATGLRRMRRNAIGVVLLGLFLVPFGYGLGKSLGSSIGNSYNKQQTTTTTTLTTQKH